MGVKNIILIVIFMFLIGLTNPAMAQFRRDMGRMIGKVIKVDERNRLITVRQGDQEKIFKVNPSQLDKIFKGVDVFVSFRLDSNEALYLKIIEPK